jgi:hypothetical protein
LNGFPGAILQKEANLCNGHWKATVVSHFKADIVRNDIGITVFDFEGRSRRIHSINALFAYWDDLYSKTILHRILHGIPNAKKRTNATRNYSGYCC